MTEQVSSMMESNWAVEANAEMMKVFYA